MEKKWDFSLTRLIFYVTMSISAISIVCVGVFSLLYDYSSYKDRLVTIKEHYMTREKSLLSTDIYEVYDIIKDKYKNINDKFDHNIENNLIKARQKILLSDKFAKTDIRKVILQDAIKEIINLPDAQKYTIYNISGKPILNPLPDDVAKDDQIVKSMVEKANSKRIELIDIKISNLETVRMALMRIDELGIVLGYYENLKKLQKDFIQSVRNLLKQQHKSENHYTFLISKNDQKYLYSNFKDFDDIDFKKYPKEAQEAYRTISNFLADGTNEGFVTYAWIREDGTTSNKLSFVKDTGIMGLIIGRGRYLDALEASIEKEREIVSEQFKIKTGVYIICLLLILLTVLVVGKVLKARLDDTFVQFRRYFEKANVKNEPISSDKLNFKELRDLADQMNVVLLRGLKESDEKEKNLSLLEQYRQAIEDSTIVSKADPNGIITFANKSFCELSGYTESELMGRSHNIIRHPDEPRELFANLWSTITSKRVWEGIIKNMNKEGKPFYVKAIIMPILDRNGNIEEYITIQQNITDLIEKDRRIQSHLQDPLTGLPNRQALIDKIFQTDNAITLASFDISRFKEINEYYGFDMGDAVIQEVGRAIEKILVGKELYLYKLTSDNFAIFANYNKFNPIQMKEICLEIISYFKENPFMIAGNKFDLNIVFGISSEANYFITSEMAKDYAKLKKTSVVIFDENKDLLIGNVNLTHNLKRAIDENRIVIYRQAIVDNETKKPVKYECLVRMMDENGNIISPFYFLNLAKRSNLYQKLTKIVIEEAFKFFYDKDEEFSVNLAIDDIVSGSMREFLRQKLAEYDGIGKRLTLEIVEDEGIQNFKEVAEFIDEMHSFGCSVAVDDFGTGYSNFEYLMRLKADFVKIDGSMIKDINQNDSSRRVVELMVGFAKQLNIKTVAEFVHSEEVSAIVDEIGIDESQGYYYDEPKPLS